MPNLAEKPANEKELLALLQGLRKKPGESNEEFVTRLQRGVGLGKAYPWFTVSMIPLWEKAQKSDLEGEEDEAEMIA